MAKLLKQCQNAGKALELKLEQWNDKYHVILAGMTIFYNRSCTTGACEGPGNGFFMPGNNTYANHAFANVTEAEQTYLELKAEYID